MVRTFFFTLVTGPRRSLSLKLSDTRVYEPQIRARLGTTAHFSHLEGLGRGGVVLEGADLVLGFGLYGLWFRV